MITHGIGLQYVHDDSVTPGFAFSVAVNALRDNGLAFAIALPEAREGRTTPTDRGYDKWHPPTVGERMLVYADETQIREVRKVLERYSDYIDMEPPRLLPDRPPHHLLMERVRTDDKRSNAATNRALRRACRRAAQGRREPVTDEEIANRQKAVRRQRYPYLHLKSHTTCQQFQVAFRLQKVGAALDGRFDTYGLSRDGATVPAL